tara:strand:+ start:8799 stop:9047 length:249 start_codon:yes stop_codon:yes gene_type:complete
MSVMNKEYSKEEALKAIKRIHKSIAKKKLCSLPSYSLDCSYYAKEFDSIDDLLEDVKMSGMDPNYEITKSGVGTGEQAIDLM